MRIGDVIKQARIQKGYTQEELAELVGVQKSAVAKWENGRVSEIKRSNLYGLAQALGISPTSLVGDSEADKKEKHRGKKDRNKNCCGLFYKCFFKKVYNLPEGNPITV